MLDVAHLITELETGRYLANATNVLLLGPPGVGKTHLAIGLGRKAIEFGYSCRFVHAADLAHQLIAASHHGALEEAIALFARPHLLIIDELGYLPLEREAGHLLFHRVPPVGVRDLILGGSWSVRIQVPTLGNPGYSAVIPARVAW